MIVITGATGNLGQHVIASLLKTVAANTIIAAVRNPAKAASLAALGVQVRQADYNDGASLDAAFQGASKVLLISSSEVGQRAQQHQNVIDAAGRAGVALLAYTSVLRADTTPLGLAAEHVVTEAAIRARPACRTASCATAGTWKITPNTWRRCSSTAWCWVRRRMAASHRPRGPTMLLLPPPC